MRKRNLKKTILAAALAVPVAVLLSWLGSKGTGR